MLLFGERGGTLLTGHRVGPYAEVVVDYDQHGLIRAGIQQNTRQESMPQFDTMLIRIMMHTSQT